MSKETNGVEMTDDTMTLARVERWLAKFSDLPDDKVSFAIKVADFLMGVVKFQNEQMDRMRDVDAIFQNAAKEAAHAGRELRRIRSEPTISYRVRISRKDAP